MSSLCSCPWLSLCSSNWICSVTTYPLLIHFSNNLHLVWILHYKLPGISPVSNRVRLSTSNYLTLTCRSWYLVVIFLNRRQVNKWSLYLFGKSITTLGPTITFGISDLELLFKPTLDFWVYGFGNRIGQAFVLVDISNWVVSNADLVCEAFLFFIVFGSKLYSINHLQLCQTFI